MNDFITWLDEELSVRGWTRAELSRVSGVSESHLSLIYSQQRKPGKNTCKSIALALHLPPEYVFRIAGLLPDQQEPDELRKEILNYKLAELSTEELDRVLEYIEFLQHRRDAEIKINREGVTPPEVVKTKVRT